jgi:hypothetical protein
MLTESELRQFDHFVAAISRQITRFPKRFQYCALRAVTESTKTLFCVVRAGLAKSGKARVLEYGKFKLIGETFHQNELISRLEALNATGKFVAAQTELVFELKNSFPSEYFQRSYSPYHGWPGHLYDLGVSQTNFVSSDPLVAPGLVPYLNVRDAISQWVSLPVSDSDSRFQKLLLFVPRFDARIRSLEFSKGLLKTECDSSVRGLHLAVLATDGEHILRFAKALRKQQEFELMPNPTGLNVFITNNKSEILDSFVEDERWASRERVIFAGTSYSKELMNMIRRGETDSVEFKEFIRLDDRKKAADIVKAVIAFANTTGGTILIGVSDDAEIFGVDMHIPHDAKKAKTFDVDYFRGIRELLKQKLNRIPAIETSTERVGDKTILAIRVSEGSAKPYVNVQTKEIFIRRGGSDVRPDPDSELRSMFASANPWQA